MDESDFGHYAFDYGQLDVHEEGLIERCHHAMENLVSLSQDHALILREYLESKLVLVPVDGLVEHPNDKLELGTEVEILFESEGLDDIEEQLVLPVIEAKVDNPLRVDQVDQF